MHSGFIEETAKFGNIRENGRVLAPSCQFRALLSAGCGGRAAGDCLIGANSPVPDLPRCGLGDLLEGAFLDTVERHGSLAAAVGPEPKYTGGPAEPGRIFEHALLQAVGAERIGDARRQRNGVIGLGNRDIRRVIEGCLEALGDRAGFRRVQRGDVGALQGRVVNRMLEPAVCADQHQVFLQQPFRA